MKPKIDSPYVGLVPYTEEDAQFFFGRERDQQRILANLFASRLTILYGASGVGKSSVLRAGIVQEVRQRIAQSRDAGEAPELAVVYFKDWKGDVLGKLRAAISSSLVNLLGKDYIADLPASLSFEDLLVAAGKSMGGDLLLILDQFEEYFLYHPAAAPDQFALQFANAANHPGVPANFLISLRDDAISRLDRFKPLIPNLFSNYLRIHHLTGEGARDAILKPVECYNNLPEECKAAPGKFEVEPDLVGQVIEQAHRGRVLIGQVGQGRVATAPAASAVETPYLQLVMTRLWREEVANASHMLRCETLRKLGGAETIIKTHLEHALDGLNPAERDICAKIFPHLVTPSGTKIAHTVPNLAKFAKVNTEAVEPLLKSLAGSDKRILTPVAPPDGRPGELQYEIYHDSLAQAVLAWQARYEANCESLARAKEKNRIAVIAVVLLIFFVIAVVGFVIAKRQSQIAGVEREHARTAELKALALASQYNAAALEKEKAEAARNHDSKLVEELQKQINRVHTDASKFTAQAAAKPDSVNAGPALADLVNERYELQRRVRVLEAAQVVGQSPRQEPLKAPVQQTIPDRTIQVPPPVTRQLETPPQSPPPVVRVPAPEVAQSGPPKVAQSTPPKPVTHTLCLSRILCREDGGPGKTEWSFIIYISDGNGKETLVGAVGRRQFHDKKPPQDLEVKFSFPMDPSRVHIVGRREDNPLMHTSAEGAAIAKSGAVTVKVQAKRPKDGDFDFTFKVD